VLVGDVLLDFDGHPTSSPEQLLAQLFGAGVGRQAPLKVLRGGKVVEAGYEGAGGNAVVIHGTGSNFDNVYMHLRNTPLVRTGQRVYTGQLIGFVGDTGDASVCHLHFELWQGPWWNGGHTVDPLPTLRAWDALS